MAALLAAALALLTAAGAADGSPSPLPPGEEVELPEPTSEGGFMGRAELPAPLHGAALVPDPAVELIIYFQGAARDPELELQLQARNEGPGEERFAFVQSLHGVPIIGTFALAQLQDGLLHYERHLFVAVPQINVMPAVSAAAAQNQALWIARGGAEEATPGQGAPSLAVYYQTAQCPALVWVVPVRTHEPYASLELYVDAQSGGLRGRHKTSMDGGPVGTVSAMVEPCCQGDRPVPVPMPHIEYAKGLFTDSEGRFAAEQPVSLAQVRLVGPYFAVEDYGNPAWLFSTQLHGGPAFNDVSLNKAPLSLVDPFYYASQARAWLRRGLARNSNLAISRADTWTRTQFPIRVNLPSGFMGFKCNAFYDGTALNFYRADRAAGCNNSGQAAKIVYHEYGHGAHDHLTWSRATFDAQVSEAAADYIAATMTGDPNITGLMGCNKVLSGRTTMRTCVNHYTYCRGRKCNSFPHDEPHNAAPVLCAALWEMRQNMGSEAADDFFLRFLTVATDMNAAYEAAIAADDDEDGDPMNGTDHSCLINRAFLGAEGGIAHFPDAVRRAVPCDPSSMR